MGSAGPTPVARLAVVRRGLTTPVGVMQFMLTLVQNLTEGALSGYSGPQVSFRL